MQIPLQYPNHTGVWCRHPNRSPVYKGWQGWECVAQLIFLLMFLPRFCMRRSASLCVAYLCNEHYYCLPFRLPLVCAALDCFVVRCMLHPLIALMLVLRCLQGIAVIIWGVRHACSGCIVVLCCLHSDAMASDELVVQRVRMIVGS